MSKPISFGFGKPKSESISIKLNSKPSAPKPIALPAGPKRPAAHDLSKSSRSRKGALHDDDSDHEDEAVPKHEAVTGFSSSGAILNKPHVERQERVIVNAGNGDWRRRGRKDLLPSEVRAQQEAIQNGNGVVTVERNEVSTASGLQYAGPSQGDDAAQNGIITSSSTVEIPQKELTEDERALAALLDDGSGTSKSNVVIATKGNMRLHQRDEVADFREDVAIRPESATLEEYAAMPVEEFGMAMLRGMGQKRKANGEVIDFNTSKEDDKNKHKRAKKQEGFLGIGAKPAPGIPGVELGAWGKADMRKNNRGEGFFTPVMMEDKRTGERITEEEFEKRKKQAKETSRKENGDDWKDRRDRNLEKHGRDNEANGSRKRDRDRERDRSDRDYESSKSRRDKTRDRSRSAERSRRRRDNDDDDDDDNDDDDSGNGDRQKRDKHRSRDYDRNQDKYYNGERHSSGSSRKDEHKDRHRDKDRDRDRDRDYRDRKDHDRDDRKRKDRR